jgi:trehalose synthase
LTNTKSIDMYADVVGKDAINEIKELVDRLDCAKIAHVSSTRTGGGVAEILQNLVPLANSTGLVVKWHTMKDPPPEFFDITKKIHNALQGMNISLKKSMKNLYINYNKEYASDLNLDSDVVFIHDPQPAPLIDFVDRSNKKFLWRCHIDITDANLKYWKYIKNFIKKYDVLIFSLDKYIRDDVSQKRIYIVSPTIDPLSEKNKQISPSEVLNVIKRFGINAEEPIITQVARFDYWKDPLGVIDCYKLIKRKIPNVQLLLIGSMPQDDPEGKEWYEKTIKKAKGEKGIHILTDLDGVRDLEVNAFQRASNVVIQKSIREGFGLSVTEALWKGTPVVATRAGGIPLQVIDGVTGFLIDDINDAAEKITYLIKHQYFAKMLGMEGREHVRRNFLITRHLRDYIKIHLEIID